MLVDIPFRRESGALKYWILASASFFQVLTFSNSRVPRRKIAFLVGITYAECGSKQWELKEPTNDVARVKSVLIEHFGFAKEDIVVLSEGEPSSSRPTQENIQLKLEEFVLPEDDVDYFFLYSGHSYQRREVKASGVEEDGLEEYIIPCDAVDPIMDSIIDEKTITDKELNQMLVKRLRKGCRLFTIVDSCHSGTLLNLRHQRCNRVGDTRSLLRRATRHFIVEPIFAHLSNNGLRAKATSETDRSCSGFCPRLPIRIHEKPLVICISACKDHQETVEFGAGGIRTMTQAIVNFLEASRRRPTLEEIMTTARDYVRDVKQKMKVEVDVEIRQAYPMPLSRINMTKPYKEGKQKCRDTWEPQMSSNQPLNMKAQLRL